MFDRTRPIWLLAFALWGVVGSEAANHILELNGQGSFVELPEEVCRQFEVVTIEGWFRWEKLRYYSQPIAFGDQNSTLGVNNFQESADVQFFLYQDKRKPRVVRGGGLIRPGRWIHLACVMERGRMALYANGILVGEDVDASGAAIRLGEGRFFGRSPWRVNADFRGALDEIRIWSAARTESEIRGGMNQRMKGNEPGLLALWNFEEPNWLADSGANRWHGKVVGEALCVAEAFPAPGRRDIPAVVKGKAVGPDEQPVMDAQVWLEKKGRSIVQGRTDERGEYRLVFLAGGEPLDLAAESGVTGAWKPLSPPSPGGEHEENLELREAISLKGRMVALDGRPQYFVQAQAVAESSDGRSGRIAATARTDRQGEFEFVNLRPGRYRISVPGTAMALDGNDSVTFTAELGREAPEISLRLRRPKTGRWRSFTHVDGLPHNRVQAMASGQDGALWLGLAYGGLARFDGETFEIHHFGGGESNRAIQAIHAEDGGRLWLGTEGGLYIFDGVQFKVAPGSESMGERSVRAIAAAGGGLWLALERGAARLENGRLEMISLEDGLAGQTSWAVDAEGDRAWLGTSGGLTVLNHRRDIIGAEPGLIELEEMGRADVTAVARTRNGDLWVGASEGLYRVRDEKVRWWTVDQGLSGGRISCLLEASDGKIWVGTQGGVSAFDGQGFVSYTSEDGLVSDDVTCLHESEDGLLWVGTSGGISYFEGDAMTQFDGADGLPAGAVQAFEMTAEGDVRIGTATGLALARNEQIVPEITALPEEQGALMCFTSGADGSVWIGCSNGAVHWRDGALKPLIHEYLQETQVTALAIDPDGAVVFGTSQYGIINFDDGRFENVTRQLNIDWFRVVSLCQTRDRGLAFWGVGGNAGDQGLGTVRGNRFERGPAGLEGTASTVVQSPDGALWIGTQENGAYRLAGGEIRHFTRADGLLDNSVNAIDFAPRGLVWFGTAGGVSGYDGEVWTSLDSRDGLGGEAVRAVHCEDDGTLWIGTRDGVVRYRPTRVKPRVRIVSVTAEQSYTNLSTDLPTLIAGHRVTFDFASVDFQTARGKRQYRYRVRRLANDAGMSAEAEGDAKGGWIRSGGAAQFEWTPSQAGLYEAAVQAVDRDLNYSEPARVELLVALPWYENRWVLGPMIFSLVSMVTLSGYFGMRWLRQRRDERRLREDVRIREERQRAREQFARRLIASQEAERKRLAGDLHDGLGQHLLLIKNMAFMGAAKDDLSESAKRLREIGDIAAQAAGEVRVLSQALRPAELDRLGITKALISIAYRASELSAVEIATEIDDIDGVLPAEWEINLYRVVQEGINNIIKHSQARRASIRLVRRSKELLLTISDSGSGSSAGARGEGRGFGLKGVAERVELMKGSFELRSLPGRGTVWNITLPISDRDGGNAGRDDE